MARFKAPKRVVSAIAEDLDRQDPEVHAARSRKGAGVMTYAAPLNDMRFVLNRLAGLPEIATLPGYRGRLIRLE